MLLVLFISSCATVVVGENLWYRDVNVCKTLVEDVLVYPVFVEAKKGDLWFENDKKEFKDSLNVSLKWIEEEAKKNNVKLRFITEVHPKTMKKGFPGKTIIETYKLFDASGGFKKFNKHYDGLSKKVAPGIVKEELSLPKVGAVKNKERLIAKLRNIYGVESVVLMFVHKPEGIDHFYHNFNSMTNEDVEFMVTTYKSPTVLAYQVLDLFGAAPLMYSKTKKKEKVSWEFVQDNFPKDIMAGLGKRINQLEIGHYTQYLIGWHRNYKEEYKQLASQRNLIVR